MILDAHVQIPKSANGKNTSGVISQFRYPAMQSFKITGRLRWHKILFLQPKA